MLIPKRLQIETYFGCNARCIMCFVGISPQVSRKKGMMDMALYRKVVDALSPYSKDIEKVDLFGLGEPLLDKLLFDRIRYAKGKGFRNMAISTNADLMDAEMQEKILESGIETVIVSIDGTDKATHEEIRVGVDFDRVVLNTEGIISLRNKGNHATRFVLRFIRQKGNYGQWDAFREYWRKRVSFDRNDLIIMYDVNTMGGEAFRKSELVGESKIDDGIELLPCSQVFERLIILNDGSVPLCCEDTPHARHCMGNVRDADPIAIFNSGKFEEIRDLHRKNMKSRLEICRKCTVLYSEKNLRIIGAA